MIGELPRYRPRGLRRPTLAYTRLARRRSIRGRARTKTSTAPAAAVNTEIVLFDHGPAEFPVATVRPREARARVIALLADLQHWLAARWAWFRPRTVPCAVAALGMFAVMASADYLAHGHEKHGSPSVITILISPR
jgi:hypothetical protein